MAQRERTPRSSKASLASWTPRSLSPLVQHKDDEIIFNARPVSSILSRPSRIGIPAEAYLPQAEQRKLQQQRARRERLAEGAVAYGVGCGAGPIKMAEDFAACTVSGPKGDICTLLCCLPCIASTCLIPNAVLGPSCIGGGGALYLQKHGKLDQTMSNLRQSATHRDMSPSGKPKGFGRTVWDGLVKKGFKVMDPEGKRWPAL